MLLGADSPSGHPLPVRIGINTGQGNRRHAGDAVIVRQTDVVALHGRHTGTRVFELNVALRRIQRPASARLLEWLQPHAEKVAHDCA